MHKDHNTEKKVAKVVIIGSAYPLRGGGIATYNERLAKAFIDEGCETIIHTFSLQYPGIFFPGKTQYSQEDPPVGLNIKVSINSVNPFNWIKAGRIIKKENADMVIIRFWIPFMGPCLGSIARIIKRNKRSKIIAITDNIVPHEKNTGGRLLTSYFVKAVDAFLTMSKSVMSDLEGFDKEKPKAYCPHPLYDNFGERVSRIEAKKHLGLDTNTSYILFFGFIREYKGLDILLEAFADSRFRYMNVKLLVAGEFYADPEPYKDIIGRHKLEKQVVLRDDFIPNTEVAYYFCASDIVVQPYKTATQSGVTQVAYHFNKPMVTTNVGGLAELVPHGVVGYVTEPDPAEVADAMYDFFEGLKYEEFSANVREQKKKFSWERLLDHLHGLYRQIKL